MAGCFTWDTRSDHVWREPRPVAQNPTLCSKVKPDTSVRAMMEVTGSRVCRLPNPNMIVAQQNLRLVRKLARPPSDPRADSLDLNRPEKMTYRHVQLDKPQEFSSVHGRGSTVLRLTMGRLTVLFDCEADLGLGFAQRRFPIHRIGETFGPYSGSSRRTRKVATLDSMAAHFRPHQLRE